MLNRMALSYAKLQLNIDMTDLEENWLDGYECAQRDVGEDANPYAMGTKEYHEWNEGWWAGFYNEEKVFDWHTHSVDTMQSVMHRIQTAVPQSKESIARVDGSSKMTFKFIKSHFVQVLAAILAFGLCAQFADLLM
jgi:hypothetical protein